MQHDNASDIAGCFGAELRQPGYTCRKTEVMNLLESAGFSRANPYYVVQQGKVGYVPATFILTDRPVTNAHEGPCIGCCVAFAIAMRMAVLSSACNLNMLSSRARWEALPLAGPLAAILLVSAKADSASMLHSSSVSAR